MTTPDGGMPRVYSPAAIEGRLYREWMEAGYFAPSDQKDKQPFVIIMPPPNVTGELHVGHALTATTEDIMARWHRMMGEPTLWLPGVDHAGIATQVVVERELAKEGLTRQGLGREAFLTRVWDWVHRYRGRIQQQHERLGASCDWSRERFTLDPGPSKAVRTTFVNLYRKGLIYRGERIINWCPRCATALSDLEVEHQEVQGNLYYIHYPLADGSGHVTVATTRPETMLADTAVAVNPEDSRYRQLVGKKVVLPIMGREIPVIGDAAVKMDFGTGALKITPGHDPVDFEVGQRHNLPVLTCIGQDASMNEGAGPFRGLDRLAARKAVVEQLRQEGLLDHTEPYQHAVGHCQRCRQIVEPLVSQQWFVRMAPLAQPAIEAVEKGAIRIEPERFAKVYLNWMYNVRDWCISRQLWWGHRIPVWHCGQCGGQTVDYADPSRCASCGSRNIEQDPDVLDTWFSSALWPHSTLGWPEEAEDFRRFYPTSVMETGYDIIFFWVARMIVMGLENTSQVPFHTVYLHGLVRDVEGQKMSKTRGNVVDPIKAVDSYGCDALRFALTAGNAPGNDLRLGQQRLEGGRNFANKLWNASRFVLSALEGAPRAEGWSHPQPTHLEDRWVMSRLNRLVGRVQGRMEAFLFGEAVQDLYEFVWDEFCDWYLEMAKVRLRSGGGPLPLPVLAHVLEATLRLLHPFMPFITEEIWLRLKALLPDERGFAPSIMVEAWPQADLNCMDGEAEEQVMAVMGVVRAVRTARTEFRLEPRRPLEAAVDAADLRQVFLDEAETIRALAHVDPLRVLGPGEPRPPLDGTMNVVLGKVAVVVPLRGLVDMAAERARLQADLRVADEHLARLEQRLQDTEFLSKAPEEVVERERTRFQTTQERRQKVQELLAQMAG